MNTSSSIQRLVLLAGLALGAGACKRSTPADEAASSAKASASSAPASLGAPRCRKLGPSVTVGQPGSRKPVDVDADEAPVGEPFAIEVGSAIAYAGGFAVGALELRGTESHATVALVSASGGKNIELGRVHGDVEPPRLAARDGKLVAVVPDSDAGGTTLRVAVLRDASVVWGVEAPEGRDESQVFDVELGARRGLVVWDEYDKREARGLVRGLTFDAVDPSNATPPRTLSNDEEDAEAAQLTKRAGGFWLAWVSRQRVRGSQARGAGRPGSRADAGALPRGVLDLGRRVLRVVQLDELGTPLGEPLNVSGLDSHVLVFDLAATATGALLVAWRDDSSLPGVETGAVKLARVGADGSVDKLMVEDEEIGAGAPALLEDASPPKGAPAVWLTLAGISDAPRLAALGSGLSVLDVLAPEPAIGAAEPLALDAGRMLVARPRGLAVDLETVQCIAGPAPDAG